MFFLTGRHEGLESVGDSDAGLRLVHFHQDADDSGHRAHRSVQHVAILGLKCKIKIQCHPRTKSDKAAGNCQLLIFSLTLS